MTKCPIQGNCQRNEALRRPKTFRFNHRVETRDLRGVMQTHDVARLAFGSQCVSTKIERPLFSCAQAPAGDFGVRIATNGSVDNFLPQRGRPVKVITAEAMLLRRNDNGNIDEVNTLNSRTTQIT